MVGCPTTPEQRAYEFTATLIPNILRLSSKTLITSAWPTVTKFLCTRMTRCDAVTFVCVLKKKKIFVGTSIIDLILAPSLTSWIP